MSERFLAVFRDCIMRVDGGDGLLGSAFFVGQDLAVTCAHVVGAHTKVQVTWRGVSRDAAVKSIAGFIEPDICLLECGFGYHPAVLLQGGVDIADSLFAHGFSTAYLSGDDVTVVCEGFSSVGRRQLLKLKGGQLEPGFSGAPLLSVQAAAVVGMIRTTRDRALDLGGRAVPAAVLLQIPEIADANWTWHLANRTWLDAASGPLAVGERRGVGESCSGYLRMSLNRFAARFVAGSERVRLNHLFGVSRLLENFPWDGADSQLESVDLLDYLERLLAEPNAERTLILSDPGLGKSTLLIGLFWRAAAAWQRGNLAAVPILVDARDYIGVEGFGTAPWMAAHYERLLGVREDVASLDLLASGRRLSLLLLVDSLDEYLAGLTPVEAERELTKPLFREATVLACRAQFFERFLAKGSFAETVSKLDLLPWSWGSIESYVRRYLREFAAGRFDVEESLVERFSELPLLDVCRVPLRLNMMLDIWSTGETKVEALASLAGLYSEYLFSWLSREAGRPGSVFGVDEKLRLLREVAWRTYEYSGGLVTGRLTREELGRIVAPAYGGPHSLDPVLDDLQYRTIFVHDSAPFVTGEGAFSFAHKSFQEFLLASYLFDLLLTSDDQTARAFSVPLSPDVSEFLKGMIAAANADAGERERIARGAVHAFEQNALETSPDGTGATRLARQQLAYYLGNLRTPTASAFLRQRLEQEEDVFTRRGIMIGLAFGGNLEYIDAYVELLRTARASMTQEGAVEAAVNMGFHLSFFGDQPFDVRRPEHDQGLPFCDRTVRRLTYQLGTTIDRASWRLNLFTLVDLASHRTASVMNYRLAVRECRNELSRILVRMREDLEARQWPELLELERILIDVSEE